jgi:glycosyltransferase involved in cell wall biosynthesis
LSALINTLSEASYRLKVAHVTATFPPYLGGTGNVAYHHARLLHALGHEVTVYTASIAGQDRATFPFEVKHLRSILRVGNAALTPSLPIRLKGYDLIHMHYPYLFGAELALLAASLANIPVVLTYHNQLQEQHRGKAALFKLYNRLMETRFLQRANRVLAVRMDHLLSIRPDMAGQTGVMELGHGVDTDLFRPVPIEHARAGLDLSVDARVILFVGALDQAHRFKNVDGLLRAFARLALPDAILLVAGDGDQRARLDCLAVELGISPRVRFLGRQAPESLPSLYSAADVLVLPSTGVESFGLVQIEAMACGTPVVASDLPGMRTIVDHGVDGYLVPPNNPAALTAALGRICRDPELSRQLGDAGRRKVLRSYAWDRIGSDLEHIYNDLLAERRSNFQAAAEAPAT